MNYYEELGIPHVAPPEEVRRAYRNLARLLHPDQQSDEALRRLAGIQMARLNEILHTLTDPKLRQIYDDCLRRQAVEAAAAGERLRAYSMAQEAAERQFRNPRGWSRFAWPGAGVLGVGLIALFVAQDIADQRPSIVREGNTSVALREDEASGAWPVRAGQRFALANRSPQASAGNPDTSTPQTPSLASESDSPPPSIVNSDNSVAEDAAGSLRPARSLSGFGGQWYYVKPASLADLTGICPPVYIDLEISESMGTVTGKYSARYTVGERQISPFVEFEFAGPVTEPAANLEWNGSGGAAGRVRLKLLSARTLQVEWSADAISKQIGLGSGIATLVRRESR